MERRIDGEKGEAVGQKELWFLELAGSKKLGVETLIFSKAQK